MEWGWKKIETASQKLAEVHERQSKPIHPPRALLSNTPSRPSPTRSTLTIYLCKLLHAQGKQKSNHAYAQHDDRKDPHRGARFLLGGRRSPALAAEAHQARGLRGRLRLPLCCPSAGELLFSFILTIHGEMERKRERKSGCARVARSGGLRLRGRKKKTAFGCRSISICTVILGRKFKKKKKKLTPLFFLLLSRLKKKKKLQLPQNQRTLSCSTSKLQHSSSLPAAPRLAAAAAGAREEEQEDKASSPHSSAAASPSSGAASVVAADSASDNEGGTPAPFAAAARRLTAGGGELLQNGGGFLARRASILPPEMLALVVVCSPPAPPPPAAAPKKKEKSKQKNNKSVSLKFSAARSLVRKVVEKINKPLNDFRAKKRAAAKNKRNAAIAAAAKASPAAKAKQSDRRLANFDRRVGYLNALVMAASLFEEYEQAAVDFAIAAEEDAKLFAVRRLFEKSERAAAKAEAEAGAELALSSFAVCAVFIRAERKKVAEEAAEARASVDMEAAVGAMVVRKERAAAKRDVVAAARRRTKAERKAGATLALSSARFLFVRAEKAAAAVEAELGAELALDAARTVFVRAARAAERRELVAAARRAAIVKREAGAELASASASSLFVRAERAARAVEAGVGAELALSAMRAAPLAAPDGVAADCDLARCPRRRAPRLCRGLPLLAVFWFFLFSTTFTFSI